MGHLVPLLPGIVLLNGFGTHWETYLSSFVAVVAAGLGLGLSFVVSGIVLLVVRHPSINLGPGLQIKGIAWRWFVAVGAILFFAVFIMVVVSQCQNIGGRFSTDWEHWDSFVSAVTGASGLGLGFFVSGIVMRMKGPYARSFVAVGVILLLAVFIAVLVFMERNNTPLF